MDNKIEDNIRDYDHKDCNCDYINHVVVLTRITINSSLCLLYIRYKLLEHFFFVDNVLCNF